MDRRHFLPLDAVVQRACDITTTTTVPVPSFSPFLGRGDPTALLHGIKML